MDTVNCPECSNRAVRMTALSYVGRFDDFYRCESCGQVLQLPKETTFGVVVQMRHPSRTATVARR